MPYEQHFDEPITSVVFRGIISTTLDRFLDKPSELFDHPSDISLELIERYEGFTYQIKINDMKYAELQDNSKFEVVAL